MSEGRIPWKESNLALIGSDLDHKIKAAAADGEEQWNDLGTSVGTRVWRIEQFKVVPWPEDKYGTFHKGDSYVVLNTYQMDDGTDTLYHDLHIWIGSESSQDEYGTAAYKMVEADDKLGGGAIQHRQVEGKESSQFRSYFDTLTYLEGGVASGFTHVEATPDTPHLYKIKGTDRGMSLSQVTPISKSSLNSGDCFVLFANRSTVWLWIGEGANPDERARANSLAERLCSEGTVTVLDQGAGDSDDAAFWAYFEDGEIQEAQEGDDEEIEEFCPLLFKLAEDPDEEPEQVAKGEEVTYGSSVARIGRDNLQEGDVFLLDAGWEVFLWLGSNADSNEKISAMAKAEAYCKEDPRTADLPLTLVKSGYEPSDFSAYFL